MKCLPKSLKLWLKRIYVSFFHTIKDCTIIFTNIVFVLQYLRNLESSVRIQSYSQRSYSSPNLCGKPIPPSGYNSIHKYCISHLIFAYNDSSISIQCKYVSSHIMTRLSGSNANIVRVVSWLVRQDPTQILFCILIRYGLSRNSPKSGIGLFKLVQTGL